MGCGGCKDSMAGKARHYARGAYGKTKAKLGVDKAPDELANERAKVCFRCPHARPCHNNPERKCRCSLCGCDIVDKVRVKSERCPLLKWPGDEPRFFKQERGKGLWQFDGTGLYKAKGMRNSFRGLDAYICCPGPSLKDVDPEALKRPGAAVLAVNTAYPHISRPDLWVGMDLPACYDDRLLYEPFPKISQYGKHDFVWHGRRYCQYPRTFFAETTHSYPIIDLPKHLDVDELKFTSKGITLFLAIHMALWLGMRRIRLLGTDLSMERGTYYDARDLQKAHQRTNEQVYAETVRLLGRLEPALKEHGMELVSCTPNSAAHEALPYLPLDEALDQSSVNLARPRRRVLHSDEAKMCKWTGRPSIAEQGILIGTDENQEYMLKWWFQNLRRHVDLPVAVADFGMSKKGRQLAEALAEETRGMVFTPRAKPQVHHPWFNKVFAILDAPFDSFVWTDMDTEVRGDFTDQIGQPHLRMVREPEPTEATGTCSFNSGVVFVQKGDPDVEAWAVSCLDSLHRGDQEALDEIQDEVTIVELDVRYNKLNAYFEQTDEYIYHHTGNKRNGVVRRMIEEQSRE